MDTKLSKQRLFPKTVIHEATAGPSHTTLLVVLRVSQSALIGRMRHEVELGGPCLFPCSRGCRGMQPLRHVFDRHVAGSNHQRFILSSWQSILLSHSLVYVSSYKVLINQELTWPAVAVGGTAGYLRTRSTPSLVAGLVLGASYGYAGKSYQPAQLLDAANTRGRVPHQGEPGLRN
jgi:hypothetical protein